MTLASGCLRGSCVAVLLVAHAFAAFAASPTLECGTTTISLARTEYVDSSVPVFVDGGSVLVRAILTAPQRCTPLERVPA